MSATLTRRVAAEFVGTAFLLAAVVGSGIMAERLANGSFALALLANAIATGCALVALILAFAPISGAHFNPVVTLAEALLGSTPWSEVLPYTSAQILGALAGTAAANLMFALPAFFWSHHARTGPAQWLGEFIATFGLVFVIWSSSRSWSRGTALAVGAYVTAAYWFTSSTSFANPAVTLARTLTDTFAGIRPRDALPFIVLEIVGGVAAAIFVRWLVPAKAPSTEDSRSSAEVPDISLTR